MFSVFKKIKKLATSGDNQTSNDVRGGSSVDKHTSGTENKTKRKRSAAGSSGSSSTNSNSANSSTANGNRNRANKNPTVEKARGGKAKTSNAQASKAQTGKAHADKASASNNANKNISKKRSGRNKRRRSKAPITQLIAERDAPQLNPDDISFGALKTVKQLQNAGYSAYLVGGCVRDALLGKHPKDFDVATSATPEQVCEVFERQAQIIGRRFRIVHVRYGREIVEVTTFRGSHSDDAAQIKHKVAPRNNRRRKRNSEYDVASQQAESGMLLRDNVFGSMEDDAWRRDFTINALYCDPADDFRVIDFVGGLDDVNHKTLRIIGDAEERYREDPVRMLRAVRFEAKLGLTMDKATAAPIADLAHLLEDVPSARLFDEVLKLFQSGYGAAAFATTRQYGLFKWLFPASDALLAQGDSAGEILITTALNNTDKRISIGKHVTPAFLFGAFMWPAVRQQWQINQQDGVPEIPALQQAAREIVQAQIQVISMPKRFRFPMQDIWALQPRLLKRRSRKCLQLLDLPRFRGAYDFMLLRIEAGEVDQQHGEWWTEIQEVPEHELTRWFNKNSNNQNSNNQNSNNQSSNKKPASKNKRKKRNTKKPDGEKASNDEAKVADDDS